MADQASNSLRIDTTNEPPSPPILAIFLVNFDHRKGYTLGWHRSLDDVPVEGVVEFKSLPSGLHNVEEDLVYFIHDDYAGLSAFVNKADDQADRAARMLAVGALVSLEHGRMGRIWRHAESLMELARAQVDNPGNVTALEEYWEKFKLRPEEPALQTPLDSTEEDATHKPNGYVKFRTMSTATTFISPHHALTPHHPALTLIDSIKLFGPLIFPLYRAALLRRRILIVTEAPVEFCCNLVYNLSILSSVSKSLLPLPHGVDTPSTRLRPLFTVGVMDIPQLEQAGAASSNHGFIACTTDDVLTSKPNLYDVLVLMPKPHSRDASMKVFPRIIVSSPELTKAFPKVAVRATQRDFRRFAHLIRGLRRLDPSETAVEDDAASSVSSLSSSNSTNKAVVEPPSWSRMAYTSFVWWASAGDRREGFAEGEEHEVERDSLLLYGEDEEEQTREVAVVAYFHRLTATIFHTVTASIARADGSDEVEGSFHDDDEDDDASSNDQTGQEDSRPLLVEQTKQTDIEINHEDMLEMGLDSWSTSDKRFVEELTKLWWTRQASVRPASIDCCGLRIL
ncbi:hypothetical protein, variant 1 [Cladophialophora immunda]|uniref:DUF4484 domain-containing protein n=2 Tax=Cladophialophora immunda TaxID=569365 RepID=A0A0D2B075_9EURO|nr:uncharacterized protein PV07_02638 [Cladophialophora immunda]XP_016251164.1 hypothetical protein, variant 1 [Cladophialophora immunda]KIW30947.1 hypothetical protein PV07_02638 [Cladophialophora immunda]KIW30948.1 hypothetical protein, variant 1 [Cladophialophora immunda]